jgi:hypothetical protein
MVLGQEFIIPSIGIFISLVCVDALTLTSHILDGLMLIYRPIPTIAFTAGCFHILGIMT